MGKLSETQFSWFYYSLCTSRRERATHPLIQTFASLSACLEYYQICLFCTALRCKCNKCSTVCTRYRRGDDENVVTLSERFFISQQQHADRQWDKQKAMSSISFVSSFKSIYTHTLTRSLRPFWFSSVPARFSCTALLTRRASRRASLPRTFSNESFVGGVRMCAGNFVPEL